MPAPSRKPSVNALPTLAVSDGQSPIQEIAVTEIPEDVLDAAATAYVTYFNAQSQLPEDPTENEILAVAARAIMAERARCAKIAADFPNMGEAMGREIAAVIRVGGEP